MGAGKPAPIIGSKMDSHTAAMLALVAALNRPASFEERFGQWDSIKRPDHVRSAPVVAITHPPTVKLGIKRRSPVPKRVVKKAISLNALEYCGVCRGQ